MDVAVAAAAAVQVASQVADPVAEKVVAEKAVADKVVVEKAVIEKVNEKAATAAAAEQEPQPVDRFSQPWNLRLSNVPVRASSLGEELPPLPPLAHFSLKKELLYDISL